MSTMRVVFPVLIAVLSQFMISNTVGKMFQVRKDADKGTCKYKGYVPGGKKINISPIVAPTAKLEVNILSKVAGLSGKAATGVMHAIKFGNILANVAPKLGPALGMIGVALSVVSEFTKPTAADILKATNKAIEKLTKEVNQKFVEMTEYVDREILSVTKERMDVEYKHMFTLWSNCINEVTAARVLECQEDAAKYIRSGHPKFLVFEDELKLYSQSNPPSGNDIKKMELTLIPAREYATLDIMQLQVLVDTYRDKNKTTIELALYKKYLRELIKDTELFVNYMEDTINIVIAGHGGTTPTLTLKDICSETKECSKGCLKEGRWWGYTACWGKCSCLLDNTLLKSEECTKHITVRADGKKIYTEMDLPNSSEKDAAENYAGSLLKSAARRFRNDMVKDVKNYWESEILSVLPTWRQILQKAKNDTESAPEDTKSLDEVMKDEGGEHHEELKSKMYKLNDEYSQRFDERFKRAYQAMKYFEYARKQ